MCVRKNQIAGKEHQDVFAARDDVVEAPPGQRRVDVHTREVRQDSAKSRDDAPGQRRLQRSRGTVDGVAFGHGSDT